MGAYAPRVVVGLVVLDGHAVAGLVVYVGLLPLAGEAFRRVLVAVLVGADDVAVDVGGRGAVGVVHGELVAVDNIGVVAPVVHLYVLAGFLVPVRAGRLAAVDAIHERGRVGRALVGDRRHGVLDDLKVESRLETVVVNGHGVQTYIPLIFIRLIVMEAQISALDEIFFVVDVHEPLDGVGRIHLLIVIIDFRTAIHGRLPIGRMHGEFIAYRCLSIVTKPGYLLLFFLVFVDIHPARFFVAIEFVYRLIGSGSRIFDARDLLFPKRCGRPH